MRLRLVIALLAAVGLVMSLAAPAHAADGDGDGVPNRRDRCPTVRGPSPDGCPDGRWRLRNANSSGNAAVSINFGKLNWQAVAGDWDGDGRDTIGTFSPNSGRWRLVTAPLGPGASAHAEAELEYISFTFRAQSGLPVVGDWNGDGTDTVGVYVPSSGTFFLRNSNTSGPADLSFSFGANQPRRFVVAVAGDWNGDGVDTVGLFRRDTDVWRLRNSNSSGAPDLRFEFGRNGPIERGIVGDWDGDGDVTVGAAGGDSDADGDVVGADFLTWRLRNTNTPGAADLSFQWGVGRGFAGAIAGDWNGDGVDTIGFRR